MVTTLWLNNQLVFGVDLEERIECEINLMMYIRGGDIGGAGGA